MRKTAEYLYHQITPPAKDFGAIQRLKNKTTKHHEQKPTDSKQS